MAAEYARYRPFRLLGYGLLGCGGLIAQAEHPFLVLIVALCGALVVDVLGAATRMSPSRLLQVVVLAELVSLPTLLIALAVPVELILAAVGCVLIGGVAERGGRFVGQGVPALCAGLLGASLAGAQTMGVISSAALGSIALLVAFALGVADVAQRRALELSVHRRQWRERLHAVTPFVPVAAESLDRSARLWLTVAVTDLVDFTATSERHAPETITAVIDDLIDAAVIAADAHGGVLDKFLGDGLLVTFAHPQRSSAVAAALEYQAALSGRMSGLQPRFESLGLADPLRWRCGIASGYCSQGPRGTGAVRAYTVIGQAVALAVRLQAACEPGGVMLCPSSARLMMGSRCRGKVTEALPGAGRWTLVETVLTLKGFGSVRGYRATRNLAKVQPA